MNLALKNTDMLARLPQVRGSYREQADLAHVSWFRVGGCADILFSPADEADLQTFLANCPEEIPVTVLGACSNTLVRDGGVPGVVIKLGRPFGDIIIGSDGQVDAGAAVPDLMLSKQVANAELSGLEFFRGIPGTVGGALRMNAGAYGNDTATVLSHVYAYDRNGKRHEIQAHEMGFDYRHCALPQDLIFTGACFQTVPGDKQKILAQMEEISTSREDTQPIKSRTGGSTFKNPGGADPEGLKAWKLIDAAGCRGLTQGDAQISELHCNFLINHGNSSAADLETLGEVVRQRVKDHSGVTLQWEIKRIGREAM